jgi:hypothetical protein
LRCGDGAGDGEELEEDTERSLDILSSSSAKFSSSSSLEKPSLPSLSSETE